MYISDRKALDILSVIFLVIGPLLVTVFSLWSWIIELVLLVAVVHIGRVLGIKRAAGLLVAGYLAAMFIHGFSGIHQMGLVPLSGFVLLIGQARGLKPKEIVFWGMLAAGILSALPAIAIALAGMQNPELQAQLVSSAIETYRESGMLESLRAAGMTEAQITATLNEAVGYYFLIIPSLLALGGLVEFLIVYYLFGERVPMARWQLPWYAIWGAILGVGGYLIGDITGVVQLKGIGINLMVVYAVVGFGLGLSLAWYFLNFAPISRTIKILAAFGAILFINVFAVMIVLFAMFDMVLNFRKLPEDAQEVS